jgi:hypothetical protein
VQALVFEYHLPPADVLNAPVSRILLLELLADDWETFKKAVIDKNYPLPDALDIPPWVRR